MVTKIKIALTGFDLMPPFVGDAKLTAKLLASARETFEIASLLSVTQGDVKAFERNFAQLRPYYFDFASLMPPSHHQWAIVGLNLMNLLTANRISDFHAEIELLSVPAHTAADHAASASSSSSSSASLSSSASSLQHARKALTNEYVAFPVQLEQYLMEGSYNKVLKARGDVPMSYYSFFMENLVNTVRERLAVCTEKAYDSLSVAEVQQLLKFNSSAEVTEFAKQRDWNVSNDGIISFPKVDASRIELPSHKLLQQTIGYATELERII
eukprot:TRINITY_DN67072_c3_g3_i1.p1 TRINITY_DN67072_c3_g3~~TRINITY_DN67072_c3_g3_i1.p1  ORF type:complete len:314 (+),score=192.79 TRINITY_DN67072_c3_g3_i1:137-943(+)